MVFVFPHIDPFIAKCQNNQRYTACHQNERTGRDPFKHGRNTCYIKRKPDYDGQVRQTIPGS